MPACLTYSEVRKGEEETRRGGGESGNEKEGVGGVPMSTGGGRGALSHAHGDLPVCVSKRLSSCGAGSAMLPVAPAVVACDSRTNMSVWNRKADLTFKKSRQDEIIFDGFRIH